MLITNNDMRIFHHMGASLKRAKKVFQMNFEWISHGSEENPKQKSALAFCDRQTDISKIDSTKSKPDWNIFEHLLYSIYY